MLLDQHPPGRAFHHADLRGLLRAAPAGREEGHCSHSRVHSARRGGASCVLRVYRRRRKAARLYRRLHPGLRFHRAFILAGRGPAQRRMHSRNCSDAESPDLQHRLVPSGSGRLLCLRNRLVHVCIRQKHRRDRPGHRTDLVRTAFRDPGPDKAGPCRHPCRASEKSPEASLKQSSSALLLLMFFLQSAALYVIIFKCAELNTLPWLSW